MSGEASRVHRVGASALLVLSSLLLAAPASASCAKPVDEPVLAEHELVFAGRVVDTSDGGRAAEVRVRDVWHGRDLPPDVVVVGGALGGGVSSVDRTYEVGTEYAFFVREEGGVLSDSSCTPTAPASSLARLDPPGVRGPVTDAPVPTDPRSAPAWWLLGSGGVAALVGGALLLRRRSHAAPS